MVYLEQNSRQLFQINRKKAIIFHADHKNAIWSNEPRTLHKNEKLCDCNHFRIKKCFPTRDHLSTRCYLTVYWRRNTILSFSSLLICPKRVQLAAYIEPDRILLSFSILTLTFPVRSQIYCINYKTTQKKARHIHNSHMFLHIFLCSPWTWFIEITRRARPKKNFSVELIFLLD